MLTPQLNDLQVWFMPQLGGDMFTHRVLNAAEGAYVLAAICEYDLYCDRHRLRPDFANAGGINRFEDIDGEKDWFSYYDDETGETVEDTFPVDLSYGGHPFRLTVDLQRTPMTGRPNDAHELKPLVLLLPSAHIAKSTETALVNYQRFVFGTEADSRIDEVMG